MPVVSNGRSNAVRQAAGTATGNLTGRGEAGSVGRDASGNGTGASDAPPGGKNSVVQAENNRPEKRKKFSRLGGNNSVVQAKKVQSPTSGKTTEFSDNDEGDEWRFEIKRKRRAAGRKNAGSTAKDEWYYWVIRVHPVRPPQYYGTLDILDREDPERLQRYWRNSGKRKRK